MPAPLIKQLDATVPGDAKPAGSSRVPSLDGLRAVSICLVLLGHLGGTRGFKVLDMGVGDYAHFGVLIFFVISGFLITRLLLSEHVLSGRVSLKLFYLRRTLRLFPASYAYIACVWLLVLAGIVKVESSDFWHAVTYTVNYIPARPADVPGRAWPIGHLWSLSVEEQFYLLWPLAFVALRPRRAIWFAGLVILLGPVARSANWLFLRGTPYHDVQMFPMVADSLATGCVLARASGWLERKSWYLKFFQPAVSFGLLALILVINRLMGYTVAYVFGTTIVNVGIAILIHRSIYCATDAAGRLLNWKPLAFVGVLSYSLYLWQQLFLNRHSSAWANAFPQNLVFAIVAALGSYLLLEKPLLRLRHRLRG